MQEAAPSPSPASPLDEAHATHAARDAGVALFDAMVRLRLVSARMVALQRSEKVAFHRASIGDEAAVVGAALAARERDWVFPGPREWGAALVRGMSVAAYVHHAFGDAADVARGHAPPDAPVLRAGNVVPASGGSGSHLVHAVGCAWAAKIRRDDSAAIALFGAATVSAGEFHNAMNFAGVMKAPAVLVCRSDGRGAAPKAQGGAVETALAYGVASARVDGSDVLAVYAVVKEALARASSGKGMTLVEAVTQPLFPSEAAIAGDDAELLALGEHDPVVRLRASLERDKLVDGSHVDALVKRTRAEIDAAVESAIETGAPDPSTIFEHVYAELPTHLSAQKREALSCRR